MIESTIKSKLTVPSAHAQSISEIITDLEKMFPVSVNFSVERKHAPNFDWKSLCDVGGADWSDGSVWSASFSTPFEMEVSETSVSAEDVYDSNLSWMTLAERLRFELLYYKQTNGTHLDKKTVTACVGSRIGLNNAWVPTVYKNRNGKGICIEFTGIKDSIGNMGPRQVWRT